MANQVRCGALLIIGYGHMTGGFPGGQSEYVRIPFGEVNLLKVPKELSGELLSPYIGRCFS